MKSSENREILIRRLKEITRLKKLDADFFKTYLPTIQAALPMVEDNRRRGDLQEDLHLAVTTIRAMMEDDLPRMRAIYSNKDKVSSDERAEFQSLSDAWEESSTEVLNSIRHISKDLVGHLGKGESLSNRSMNRNASFQVREMRARLAEEGYSILKRFQAQLNMAEGWLISAPTSGEGSVSNIRRFMTDLNQAISLLKGNVAVSTGYFLNTVMFKSDEQILRFYRLDDRLSRPETHYRLTNFQAEDLREADTSARRRVERMDTVTEALKNAGLKTADFATFGLASPVLRSIGKVIRATTSTAKFAANLPSYVSTVLSKAGDARLLVKGSRAYAGAKRVGRALLNPRASARKLTDFSRSPTLQRARSLKSKVSFAGQAFRGAKGVRAKLGLLTKKGRAKAGMYSNPTSPFYREDLGTELSRKLQSQGVTNIGSAHATDLLGGGLPEEREEGPVKELNSSLTGSSKKTSSEIPNESWDFSDLKGAVEDSEDELYSAIKAASTSGRKSSTLLSDRISQQISELQALMGLRFDNVDSMLAAIAQSGAVPITPGKATTLADVIQQAPALQQASILTPAAPVKTEAQEAEEARDNEDDRSYFRRQVVALEKLVGSVKNSPKRTSDLLSNTMSVLKGALAFLGLGGIMEMLKGLPSLFNLGSITGSLLKALPSIVGKSLGSIFSPANLKLALGGAAMMAGGFAIDAGLGALGVGKDKDGKNIKLDTAQDDKNWERMNMWEKAYSGLARGTESVGRFFFLDNAANEAANTRIGNETKYLNDKATSPSAVTKSMSPGRVSATPVPGGKGSMSPGRYSASGAASAKIASAAAAAPAAGAANAPELPKSSTVSTGKTASSNANSVSAKAKAMFQPDPGVNMALDSATKSSFEAMLSDFQVNGGATDVRVHAGRRSKEEQSRIYATSPWAGAPGSSPYEQGMAIDLDKSVADELDRVGLLKRYGFSRPVKAQPGHLVSLKAGSTTPTQASATALSSGGTGGLGSEGSPDSDSSLNPNGPTLYTSLGAKMNSYTVPEEPVSTQVPPVSAVEQTKPSVQEKSGPQAKIASTPATPSVGLSRVPTYSYLDGGFFIMNAGLMA